MFVQMHVFGKTYGSLPLAGGFLDQTPYIIHGLSQVITALGMKEKKDAKIAEAKAKARSK